MLPTRGRLYTPHAPLVLVALAVAGCGRSDRNPANGPSAKSRYVSSPDGLTGRMASDYHPFWFDYPAGCEVVPHGPENPRNYVTVRRRAGSGGGPEAVEELNVGHVWVEVPGETVWSKMPELAADIRGSFGGDVTSEGRREINGRAAYELRVRHQSASGGRRLIRAQQVIPRPGRAPLIIPAVYANEGPVTPGPVQTLRVVVIPAPDDRPFGVLILAASQGDAEGPLSAAIDSFRFGKP
jgi:hypothetical protein